MWACAAVLLFLQTPDYTAEGLKALDGGKYDQAAELFGKAVAADPKDYRAHFNLALSYTMLKRDAESLAEYKKVLELKPGLYEAELNAGILLIRDKQASAAAEYLQPAVDRKPKEFRPRLYWAQALLESGDAAKAEEQYRAALDLDAKSAAAELGLARSEAQGIPSAAVLGPGAARIGRCRQGRGAIPRRSGSGCEIGRGRIGPGARTGPARPAGGCRAAFPGGRATRPELSRWVVGTRGAVREEPSERRSHLHLPGIPGKCGRPGTCRAVTARKPAFGGCHRAARSRHAKRSHAGQPAGPGDRVPVRETVRQSAAPARPERRRGAGQLLAAHDVRARAARFEEIRSRGAAVLSSHQAEARFARSLERAGGHVIHVGEISRVVGGARPRPPVGRRHAGELLLSRHYLR